MQEEGLEDSWLPLQGRRRGESLMDFEETFGQEYRKKI